LFIGGDAGGIAPEFRADLVFIFRCLFLPFVVKVASLDGSDSCSFFFSFSYLSSLIISFRFLLGFSLLQ